MTYFYGRVTSPTKVTLQWNNPMDPVGQYNNVQVFRDGVLLKTFLTGVSMSAAIIDNLKEGQTYVFKVRGVMIVNGKSLYSDFTDPVTLTPTR